MLRTPAEVVVEAARAAGPRSRRRRARRKLRVAGRAYDARPITQTPDRPQLSEPEPRTGEHDALRQWLDFHRTVVQRKATGVTEDEARLTLTPGGVSLIGLVRHLTEVERSRFQRGFRGDASVTPLYYSDADPDGDFHPADRDTLAEALATYAATCEQSRTIKTAATSLDDLAARIHPEMGRFNLRWIMLHMIEETARHNGHADFLRETIDGSTGD